MLPGFCYKRFFLCIINPIIVSLRKVISNKFSLPRLLCLLPPAALFMLTIWPFGLSSFWSLLRWKPHKELRFNWSVGLSTSVFLSIRATVRPPSQWIPTKLTSSPTSYFSTLSSVLIPLQLFLGSSSTALFPFPSIYVR